MTGGVRRIAQGGGKPKRVVLDTNVVLSALVFAKGRMTGIRTAWQRGDCLPLVSTATAQELIRVLTYPKFRLTAAQQRELLADYLPYTLAIRIPVPPPATPLCRDAFDLPFLQLAAAGQADVLVTGDADLLILAGRVRYSITAPAEFLEMLATFRS